MCPELFGCQEPGCRRASARFPRPVDDLQTCAQGYPARPAGAGLNRKLGEVRRSGRPAWFFTSARKARLRPLLR